MKTKSSQVKNGKKKIIWGYILLSLAILNLIMEIIGQTESQGDLVVFILALSMFGGGGALLMYFGYKQKNILALFIKIENIVTHHNKRRMDEMAKALGRTQSEIFVVLRKMLEIGYFSNAYIDENLQEIVFPQQTQEQSKVPQKSVFKCSSCGGNNIVIIGDDSDCKWCGTPLNKEDNEVTPTLSNAVISNPSIASKISNWLKNILK